jgi:hypothetical protein
MKKITRDTRGESEMRERAIRISDTTDDMSKTKLQEILDFIVLLGESDIDTENKYGKREEDEEDEEADKKEFLPNKEERMRGSGIKTKDDLKELMNFGEIDEKRKDEMVNTIWPYRECMGPIVPGGAIGVTHRIKIKDGEVARARYRWKGKVLTDEEKWLVEHVSEWVQSQKCSALYRTIGTAQER